MPSHGDESAEAAGPRNSATRPTVALAFSGGLALGSYHAGAYQAFADAGLPLDWVAGSSTGSVAAAIIAGNDVQSRQSRLRSFWSMPARLRSEQHPWRHLQGWMNAARTHLVGAPGQFYPRLPTPTLT